MKIIFFIALMLITAGVHAQSFLFINEPISPFCKLMLPFMGIAIVGAIGYGLVKIIKEKDKS